MLTSIVAVCHRHRIRSCALERFTVTAVTTPIIGPISFSLQAGECLVISGPSGAGKSLLLRALADLDPHQGAVALDGRDALSFSPSAWRRQVGLLPAESAWWSDRVGEHFRAVDEALLEPLGLTPAMLGWEPKRCSTGERQRLALARLLMNRPQVLLLDEPTASLDSANTARVEGLVARLRAEWGVAVVWVSHDPAQRARLGGVQREMVDGRLREVLS